MDGIALDETLQRDLVNAPEEVKVSLLEAGALGFADFIQQLSAKHIGNDAAELHRLADQVANGTAKAACERLVAIVLSTRDEKKDETLAIAASNAISILNYGANTGLFEFRFRDIRDWSHIRIPKANLNCGMLAGCIFDEADLTGASLHGACLFRASFKHAKLHGAVIPECRIGESEQPTTAVTASKDGSTVVTASYADKIRIWDPKTWTCTKAFRGDVDDIDRLAISPDRNSIVGSSSRYSNAAIYDTKTGTVRHKLEDQQPCFGAAFSPNGKIIAIGGRNCMVQLWDASSGHPLGTTLSCCLASVPPTNTQFCRFGHPLAVDFSPDGTKVIFGGDFPTPLIWNIRDKKPNHSVTCDYGHSFKARARTVTFSCDGSFAASAADDGRIMFWNPETGGVIADLVGVFIGLPKGLACSPDGKLVACGATSGRVQLWDVASQTCLVTFQAHRNLSGLAFAVGSDGSPVLVTGGNETGPSNVKVWDFKSMSVMPRIVGHNSDVVSVVFTPDGERLITGSLDQTVRIWDWKKNRCLDYLHPQFGVLQAALSPNGQFVAAAGNQCEVDVYDLSTLKLVKKITNPRPFVSAVAFSADSSLVATVFNDDKARLFNVVTNTSLCQLEGHTSTVLCMAFSPKGSILATGSRDRKIIMWDAAENKRLYTLEGHTRDIHGLAFSPDGEVLVSIASDYRLCLWNAGTGASIFVSNNLDHSYRSVAFTPDCRYIIAGTCKRSDKIDVWSFADQKIVYSARDFDSRDEILTISVSPDGRHVATGSTDQLIKIWAFDAETGVLTLKQILGARRLLDLRADFDGAELDPHFRQLIDSQDLGGSY